MTADPALRAQRLAALDAFLGWRAEHGLPPRRFVDALALAYADALDADPQGEMLARPRRRAAKAGAPAQPDDGPPGSRGVYVQVTCSSVGPRRVMLGK